MAERLDGIEREIAEVISAEVRRVASEEGRDATIAEMARVIARKFEVERIVD